MGIGDKPQQPPIMVDLLSGAGAGLICSVLCAPLDVVKVRLQVQGSLGLHKYKGGVISTIRKIYREEGIRGPFKGIGPALINAPLFWGAYWPLYGHLKPLLAEHLDSTPLVHLLAAISAGGVADVITNPFWVTRTRIQTQVLHPEEHLAEPVSTVRMMRRIYEQEGVLAFYRGLTASLLGLSHVAIQFPLYEHLKAEARSRRGGGPETFLDLLFSSITAKLVAATLTYPHEVLRSRMMDGRSLTQTQGLLRTAQAIVRGEGVGALWAGLRVNLVRIVPSTTATFLSYEYLTRVVGQLLLTPVP